MIRVTAQEVKDIMSNCTLADSVVEGYITAANALVDGVFTDTSDISTDLLTEIEKWIAAHMIASTKQRTRSSERLGDAAITYTGMWGEGLNSTPYGQMAKALDVTGKLGKLGKTEASIRAAQSFD